MDLEKIVTALRETVRFNQTANPDIEQLTSDLVAPLSARLVYHPLLTNTNLDAIAPDFDNWNYPEWEIGLAYAIGDKVKYLDVNYEAIAAGVGNQPDTSPLFWKGVELLSEWLNLKRDEAIRTLVTDISTMKKDEKVTKEQLDHLMLYSGAGSITDRIVRQSRMVGYEIKVKENVNIKVILERLGTQFATNGNLTLYLFHSSQSSSVATFVINQNKAPSMQWTVLESPHPELFYQDFDNDIAGGTWFLMYREDDAPGDALRFNYNWDRGGCASCNPFNRSAFDKWSKFFRIHPVAVHQADLPVIPAEMFDINKIQRYPDQNWGLNLNVSSRCDLTNYVIEQKDLFAQGIARQLVVDLLSELTNTTRSNVLSEKVKQNARFALQAQAVGGEGVMEQLETDKEALNFEMSLWSRSSCLPTVESEGGELASVRTQSGGYGYRNW